MPSSSAQVPWLFTGEVKVTSESDLPMLTKNLVVEQGTEHRSSDVRSRLSCKSVSGMSTHAKEWV